MPKYSIIVPVYNCIQYLGECVYSLLGQSIKDFEILLIDDGSTDGSERLCDELAESCEKVFTFHKENGGASSARNVGIRNAKGEYLLFIDCDDTLESDTLQLADEALSERPDMAVFGMSFDYYSGETITRADKLSCAHSGLVSTADLLIDYKAYFDDNALSSACNKVIPAALLNNEVFFDEVMYLYEDLEFVMRCLEKSDSVYFIDKACYHYRQIKKNEHLEKRVSDLNSMTDNLEKVNYTASRLYELSERKADSVISCTASLYLQWLSLHLAFVKYSTTELKKALTEYISRPGFLNLIEYGSSLGTSEKFLYNNIRAENFRQINVMLRKKSIVRQIKKVIKAILRALGLRK